MDKIDPNHDLVPTLRMMDGLLFDRAADEIEKWRDAYRKAVQTPAAELMVVGPGWHERFPVITAPIVIDGLLQVHVSDRRDDMADELTRLRAENARQRGLLLWALYLAQGGSSPVGQPIRKALGIGQFDSMTPEQIHEAKVAAQGEQ